MPDSKREQVLTALFTALGAMLPAGVALLRNAVLPERIPAAGLLILRDGDPGQPEVSLSPLTYHYQHHAEIEAVVRGDARDAALDSLCAGVGAAISAHRTLDGLCDWIEAEAPRPVDLAVDGAAALKAAVVTMVLHYAAADPLGAVPDPGVEPDPDPEPEPEPEPLPANLIPEAEARFDAKGAWKTAGGWTIADGVARRGASAAAENLEYDLPFRRDGSSPRSGSRRATCRPACSSRWAVRSTAPARRGAGSAGMPI